MNLQRYVLAFMAALLATLLYAIHTDAFPKWALLLGVGAVFLTNLVQATTQAVQIPKADPASKVSTSVRPPPLPVLLLAFAFLGCSPAVKNVEAEGTYEGSQLACVDRYSTRQAIDACRESVRLKWGRLPDGGAGEGGAP